MALLIPFPLGSLHEPLTQAERTTLVAYLTNPLTGGSLQKLADYIDSGHSSNASKTIAWYIASGTSDLGKEQMDFGVISAYEASVKGGGWTAPGPGDVKSKIANPFQSFADVAQALSAFYATITSKQFWIRAAEFAVGGTLVIVGVRAAIQSELHPSSSTRPVTSGAMKTAKSVAKVVK